MEEITLGEEQLQAIDNIKQFITDKSVTAFSLIGPAGTGKTTILKTLIKYLDDKSISYCLCSPTHKASLVLSRTTGNQAITLHKLLSLSPRLDILKLDFKMLKFETRKSDLSIPYNGIVICDEASMINDDLFKLLLEKCNPFKAKIIFVSDEKQLMPVNGTGVSKVYTLKDTFTLTHIYRQSAESALMPILASLRDSYIAHFEQDERMEGSIFTYSSAKDFLITCSNYFNKAIVDENILGTKILAYTNSRVAEYNVGIRNMLWHDANEYHKGEFLTAYENGEAEDKHAYWNSMDYIVQNYKEKTIDLPYCNIIITGYNLTLYDSLYKSCFDVFILSRKTPKQYRDLIAATLDQLRIDAIHNRSLWFKYYKLYKSFTTPFDLCCDNRVIKKKSFEYGYACTVHKSQGSSIDNVFIDMWDISRDSNLLEQRQLQYVALSRTTENAFILQR